MIYVATFNDIFAFLFTTSKILLPRFFNWKKIFLIEAYFYVLSKNAFTIFCFLLSRVIFLVAYRTLRLTPALKLIRLHKWKDVSNTIAHPVVHISQLQGRSYVRSMIDATIA